MATILNWLQHNSIKAATGHIRVATGRNGLHQAHFLVRITQKFHTSRVIMDITMAAIPIMATTAIATTIKNLESSNTSISQIQHKNLWETPNIPKQPWNRPRNIKHHLQKQNITIIFTFLNFEHRCCQSHWMPWVENYNYASSDLFCSSHPKTSMWTRSL